MKKLAVVLVPIAILACTAQQDLGARPGEASPPPPDAQVAPEVPPDTGGAPDGSRDGAPDGSDAAVEEPVSPEAPTYFTSTLGFTVRDAYSYDRFSPTGNRQTRGIMLTSFVSACDKAKANVGTKVLDVVFSSAVDAIPAVGNYPISDTFEDVPMAIARVWTVTSAGCSGMAQDGGHFVSGQIVITRSDATGLEGTFEGALVRQSAASVNVTGHFVAPRCAPLGGACNP
jgi:hypothetical protein